MRRLRMSFFSYARPSARPPRRGAARRGAGCTATKQLAFFFLFLLAIHVTLGAKANATNPDATEEAVAERDTDAATPESLYDTGLPLATPVPPGLPLALDETKDNLPPVSTISSLVGAEGNQPKQLDHTLQLPRESLNRPDEGPERVIGSTEGSGLNSTASESPQDCNEQRAGSAGFSGDEHHQLDSSAAAAPEWRRGSRPTAQSAIWKALEKLFKAWLQKVFKSKESKEKCKQTKRAGGIPSVSNGDSPLKTFGYPNHDEQSGITWLQRRSPLSLVNGYPAPIRVGGEDYYVQGTYDEITAFLACFENYEVIGSKLTPDGDWQGDEPYAPVYLQIQNTREDIRSPLGGVISPLLRCGFECFLKRFFKAGGLLRHLASFDRLLKKIACIRKMGEFLPSTSTSMLFANWNNIERAQTNEERLQVLTRAIDAAHRRLDLHEDQGWLEPENVDLSAPLTLAFTTYPRPSHGVRATLSMASNVVNLGEVREKLLQLFERSFIGRAAHELNNEELEEPNYEETLL